MQRTPTAGDPSRLQRGILAASLSLITGLALTGGATAQGLARVGPVNPANGYPLFYEDSQGLRLQIATNPGLGLFLPPDAGLPVSFPDNYPDEAFYFLAQSQFAGPGATCLITMALEAAFLNGGVVPGDQIVFTRIRIRMTGLVDGATYQITHPYGTETYVAGVDGPLPGTINVTNDVGIGSAGDFSAALAGGIGPFLTTLGFAGQGIPGALIGDGGTEVLVTGSPLGNNFVRIDGPGADVLFPTDARRVNRAQHDGFVVAGEVAAQMGASVDKVVLSRTASSTAIDVWASTAPQQVLMAEVAGRAPLQMVEDVNGQYFARFDLGAGAPAPGLVTVSNFSDFPLTSWPSSAITDSVIIQSAVYTVGGDLVVNAQSTDEVGNPVLTVAVDGRAQRALAASGNGLASGALGLPVGAIPPKAVRVTSASGGVDTAPVFVQGVGDFSGATQPVVANAGADLTVASGALVALDGLASSGPIATLLWTHDAGAAIALLGADTATPTFTAPAVPPGTSLDITFTLTVADANGAASADLVVVHVNGPPPPIIDNVTVTDARFNVRRNFWFVTGTASQQLGQSISIYLGSIGDRSRPLSTAVVDGNGTWTFQQVNGTAAFAPQAGDTTVWAESALGGVPGSFVFRLR